MTDKIVEAVAKAICGEPCDYPHCFCGKPAIYRTLQVARIVIAAYQASQWQDISTAPRDGDSVLLTNGSEIHQGMWDEVDSDNSGTDYYDWTYGVAEIDGSNFRPTHWQPLPTAPSPTSSNGDV